MHPITPGGAVDMKRAARQADAPGEATRNEQLALPLACNRGLLLGDLLRQAPRERLLLGALRGAGVCASLQLQRTLAQARRGRLRLRRSRCSRVRALLQRRQRVLTGGQLPHKLQQLLVLCRDLLLDARGITLLKPMG
jgi:hypothetical protein